ncbi:SGNH hydrolase [Microthyrium microscopicum]|uniref:SGNH hydrolase n=1 Tax=Microthyrium microscopicum TaxID=703497 RepID=A0A6A6UDJ1_9PEZI|nr:SGNH hydrolase [Microthyrium microscopicum]
MWVSTALSFLLVSGVSCGIVENGKSKIETYPDTSIPTVTASETGWKSFPPNATELSYKGRWDSQHISFWSAPGLKFGFTGDKVAVTFGKETTNRVLVAYRLNFEDWQFSNISASSTHQFVTRASPGFNKTSNPQKTFELRVTNWSYGVQIAGVHVASDGSLVHIPDYPRRLEIIGDSLTAGQYNRYEGLSSWAWSLGAGLGQTEFSISAYPGTCLRDIECWGQHHGMEFQWFRTQDPAWRAHQLYGEKYEMWDFASKPAADIVLVNLGTNDNNEKFNITKAEFQKSYTEFVGKIHAIWPKTQVILMSLSNGFYENGDHWTQNGPFKDEILAVYDKYKEQGWIHYFNTTGIMRYNNIGPNWHPTDIGQIKMASHLMQYISMKFDWLIHSDGEEVEHVRPQTLSAATLSQDHHPLSFIVLTDFTILTHPISLTGSIISQLPSFFQPPHGSYESTKLLETIIMSPLSTTRALPKRTSRPIPRPEPQPQPRLPKAETLRIPKGVTKPKIETWDDILGLPWGFRSIVLSAILNLSSIPSLQPFVLVLEVSIAYGCSWFLCSSYFGAIANHMSNLWANAASGWQVLEKDSMGASDSGVTGSQRP